MSFLVVCFPLANTSKKHQNHMGPQTGRKSLANHQAPSTEGPTQPFSERCPTKLQQPSNYVAITSEIKYDIWCGIFDMWHVIFDMRCRFYRIYDDICILSTMIWILFHSCPQISNTCLCPNPGIHAPCLGRWWKSNLRAVNGWTDY